MKLSLDRELQGEGEAEAEAVGEGEGEAVALLLLLYLPFPKGVGVEAPLPHSLIRVQVGVPLVQVVVEEVEEEQVLWEEVQVLHQRASHRSTWAHSCSDLLFSGRQSLHPC